VRFTVLLMILLPSLVIFVSFLSMLTLIWRSYNGQRPRVAYHYSTIQSLVP